MVCVHHGSFVVPQTCAGADADAGAGAGADAGSDAGTNVAAVSVVTSLEARASSELSRCALVYAHC